MARLSYKQRGTTHVWLLVGPLLFAGLLCAYIGTSPQLLERLGLASVPVPPSSHTYSAPHGFKPETILQYRQLGQQLDSELMAELPVEFNSTFRTQCWHRNNGLGCLPYFYVLGGFQSGAFSLYSTLTGHPDIAEDHNARPHFWAELDKQTVDYVDNFAPSQQFLWQAPRRNIMGDASESDFAYYWSANVRSHRRFLRKIQHCQGNCSLPGQPADMVEQCKQDCYPRARAADEQLSKAAGASWLDLGLPLLMRAAYGFKPPKLIIMLRDPVERLHTAFYEYNHYHARYGATAEGFAGFVHEQLGAFEQCIAMGHSEQECILAFEAMGPEQEKVFFHCDQVLRGIYWVYLKGWMRHFPDTHIRVVYYEEYQLDRRRVVDGLTDFLEILPVLEDDIWAQLDAAHQPEADAAAQQRMLPATRAQLQRFYQPHSQKLGQLLGLGLKSPWDEMPWNSHTSSTAQPT